jgi:hypothetical protein
MRASRKVARRTQVAFPGEWAALNQDWTKLELRYYFFDDRTFGDETIALWKQELRWWLRAGIAGIIMFLPTLLLVQELSR